MPTLEINGSKVTVDDSFLRMSPEQQNAAVEEISASLSVGGKTDVLSDVGKAIPSKLAQGTINLIGIPGDLQSAAPQLGNWIDQKIGLRKEIPAAAQEYIDKYKHLGIGRMPTSAEIKAPIEAVTGPFYEPKTVPGKLVGGVAEFLPAALAGPGGVTSKALMAIGGGLGSEGAGLLAEKYAPSWAPWARLAGGVTGGLAGGAIGGPSSAEKFVGKHVSNVTGQQFNEAKLLMDEANRLGVKLTPAEAIQRVTLGGTDAGRLQRFIEGTQEGGAIIAPQMAKRPEQTRAAMAGLLDKISAPTASPSALGVRGQEAAQSAIDDVNLAINNATRPYYASAGQHLIPQSQFQMISKDPAFKASLGRLRGNEVLGPQYANMPDNSIAVVDAVTKDMRARGTALGNAMNPGFQPQESASYNIGARSARDIARDPTLGGNINYGIALEAQKLARRNYLDPVQAGPLGKMAASAETGVQSRALFPNIPLEGAADETARSIAMLNARDPRIAGELTRQHLATNYNEAVQNLVSGPNQWGAAKFASKVAGNPEQRAALISGTASLPNSGPATAADLERALRVFEATGYRMPAGSPTAEKMQQFKDLGQANIPGIAVDTFKSGGTNLFGQLRDRLDRARLGSKAGDIANMLMAGPTSIDRMRFAAEQAYTNAVLERLIALGVVGRPNVPTARSAE